MLLSVIIPVYKVEDTIDRCIGSVLSQGIADMEVIVVDDGSPDNCPQLCDVWARKDERITVVHKKNGGLSDARNAGIALAKGQYITFIDSDDYLLENTYRPLIDMLLANENADMIEYSIRQEDSKRRQLQLTDNTFSNAKDYWLSTMAWNHAYACNKIYRRSLFDNVAFPIGRLFEDLLTTPRLIKHCRCIMTTNHGCYVYTDNQKSISKQQDRHTIAQLLKAEMKAAWTMNTMPWSKNGTNLYYYMCCRVYDMISS